MKAIAIDLIRTDGGTQMRSVLDQNVYLDYRDKWLAGVEFSPIDTFYDGSIYWLADGFHRFYGAREAKRASIPCNIHQGTQRDAILFAAGANAAHGLRRTNEDKRIAVKALLNDEEWVKWSDRQIAEKAAVSVNFVSETRKQLSSDDSSPASQSADEPRVGRDGKKRKPRRKPMKPPKAASNGKPPSEPREPGEDPVEAEHVAIVDKAGKPVPDRPALRKAFSSRPFFHSTEAARNVIQNNCLQIAQLIPDGKFFRDTIEKMLKAMFHTIEMYSPAFVCRHCEGGGCPKCHKRGYTTCQSK